MKKIAVSIIGSLILISITQAGIIMTSQFQDLKNAKAQPMTQTTYLGKDMIRMDMKADKSDMSIVYLDTTQTFWMIDHKKKSYTEMTKEDLDKMMKAAEEVLTTANEALQNLPPGLADKMKNMLQPTQTKKSEMVYSKVAGDEKVNQWTCDKYEGKRDDKKEMEVWTADWKKLGLKKEDLTGFDNIGKFFQQMMKNMSWFYKAGTDEKTENMYAGFPVKTVNYEKDKAVNQYEIKSITQEDLKESVFQVPQGYKKEKMKTDK